MLARIESTTAGPVEKGKVAVSPQRSYAAPEGYSAPLRPTWRITAKRPLKSCGCHKKCRRLTHLNTQASKRLPLTVIGTPVDPEDELATISPCSFGTLVLTKSGP